MMLKKILLLLSALCSLVGMYAQDPIFRNFSAMQYHGGTQNWDIEQLPDGRMAIANNLGLLLYDGAVWSCFPIRNYSTVRALYFDKATGRIYAGASGEFGYYEVDPLTYQFVYHSLSDLVPAKNRNFGEIWKIQPWRGKLVFQSKSHLFIYNGHKVSAYQPHERIETIGLWQGRMILATHRGLVEFKGGKLFPLVSYGEEVVVRSLQSYGKGLLVATQQDGIFIYDGKQLQPFLAEMTPLLKENQVFCVELKGSKLAIGTVRCGLLVKDLKGGATLYLNSSKGLANNTILSTAFDSMGNVWMGLDNGVSCAMTNVPFKNLISEKFSVGMGCSSVIQGNTLYLGTNQGLFMFHLPFSQQLIYRQPVSVAGISGQVWNLYDIGGTIFCCADRGLFTIQGGVAKKVDGSTGTWTVCELKSHPGYLFGIDYMGAVILRKEGNSVNMGGRITTDLEMGGSVVEDADGTLWLGHWQKGIYHVALSKDMRRMKVLQLFNAKNGLIVNDNNLVCRVGNKVYISSVDGFYRYDRRRGKLVYDKAMSKLFDTYGASLKITETSSGDLWAQKADYLAIAHRKGGKYVVDSTSYRAIAKSQQVGMGNMSPLGNGMSLVNANDGFYLVRDHSELRANDYPLFIRRIVSTNDGDSVVYRHGVVKDGERRIVLPHRLNSIRIEFVQPEYLTEDAVTYSYLLENCDKRWSQTAATSKEYTKLGKGTYTFHVKAFNRISGKTQETEIKITVLPAWYETIWAYLVYILIGCAMLYELVRYLKYRADRELMIERTKRKAEQAEMKNERLQNELKHKSSELASSTMSSIHQNDILQKLDEEMALLSESVRREDKKSVVTGKINEIRNDLQSYLNDDEGWDKFEENFNVVYDDFMKKLTEKYTNLKTSDRKLCAYLRMGLSSKEMASLLNMSVRSIETARYRLRKKLNLESGENLTDFIQNFNKNLQTKQSDKHEE